MPNFESPDVDALACWFLAFHISVPATVAVNSIGIENEGSAGKWRQSEDELKVTHTMCHASVTNDFKSLISIKNIYFERSKY